MTRSVRRWLAGTAAVVALATAPAAVATIAPSGTAAADVCASAGRRVTVSGCANLSDVIAPYVVPQDAYAPVSPNASACVGWNGRWVNASGCT